MGFLDNLQKLPEQKRKTILWVVVIIIAIFFLIIWLISMKKNLRNFSREKVFQNLELPEIPENIIQMQNPVQEMQANTPQFNEEELKALEQLLEEEKQQESQSNNQ